MFSFVPVKKNNDDWRIAIIGWGRMELISIGDFGNRLNIDSDIIKTDLIRNWNGDLWSSDIKFKTQEDADKAIEGGLQTLVTAYLLAKDAKENNENNKRERV